MKLRKSIDDDLNLLAIPHEFTTLIGDGATYASVSDVLRNSHHHIFHYAGHSRYNDSLPENSTLNLTDRNITAAMLNTLWRTLSPGEALHGKVSLDNATCYQQKIS